jgi:hypothetical protein
LQINFNQKIFLLFLGVKNSEKNMRKLAIKIKKFKIRKNKKNFSTHRFENYIVKKNYSFLLYFFSKSIILTFFLHFSALRCPLRRPRMSPETGSSKLHSSSTMKILKQAHKTPPKMAVEAAAGEEEEESVMGSLSALHRREISRREKKRAVPPQRTPRRSCSRTPNRPLCRGIFLFAPFFKLLHSFYNPIAKLDQLKR